MLAPHEFGNEHYLAGGKSALIAALKAAGSARNLHTVRHIHGIAIRYRLIESDIFVANTVLSMYAKCGVMGEACRIFHSMASPDAVSWNALIAGYAQTGQCNRTALEIFQSFLEVCVSTSRTYVAAVKACAGLAARERAVLLDGHGFVKLVALERAMAVHSRAAGDGFQWDVFVATNLVNLYSRCGSLLDARRVFEGMPERNAVTWTVLLSGYVDNGDGETALEIVEAFLRRYPLDGRAFVVAVRACGCVAERESPRRVGGKLVKMVSLERAMAVSSIVGSEMDVFEASVLVDVYAKCGAIGEACRVFEAVPGRVRDVVLWTSLVRGLAENGEPDLALEVLAEFHGGNGQTFVAALKACSRLAEAEQSARLDGKLVKRKSLERALWIHREASRRDFSSGDVHVVSSLIDLYAKCGSMDDSQAVFDRASSVNLVCWNALILGYADNGDDEQALVRFDEFLQRCGEEADSWTFVAALRACVSLASREKVDGTSGFKLAALETGMAVHSRLLGCPTMIRNIYVASSLLEMYSSCGAMLDASKVFHQCPSSSRDVVLWTSLLCGYADNGDGEAALEVFRRIESERFPLDCRLLAAAVTACAACSDFQSGRAVLEKICRVGLETDTVLVGCAINLYGKCGRVLAARQVFDCSGPSGTATWNAMIAALAQQGNSAGVLEVFSDMREEGRARQDGVGPYPEPDSATLVSVLTACSHDGLVDKGRHVLESMPATFGIRPGIEHYHCVVDLLGRANRLDEALAMVEAMPFEVTEVTWTTVLVSCKSMDDLEMAKSAFIKKKSNRMNNSIKLIF